MKYSFLLIVALFTSIISFEQWSNTTNLFKDSSHMQVCAATGDQQRSMVINSYPDGGFIVYWEDARNTSHKTDIYAQKYDKTGKKLWAANGIAIANGADNEHFYSSMNADYRTYSYAATDSANGFYICYVDDASAGSRIAVQHIKSDGTKVFANGYTVAHTTASFNAVYSFPQLIADGNGGCFVSYIQSYQFTNEPWIYCLKDNNGVMKNYGGSFALRYYTNVDNECPSQLHNVSFVIQDYMIYPNLQNGCNIVASINTGSGNESYDTWFNTVVRIKKDTTINTGSGTIKYKKDSVLVYYQPSWHVLTLTCPGGGIGSNYIVDGVGFQSLGLGGYSANFAKGVAIKTDGNIIVNVITSTNRRLINGSPSNWFTQMGLARTEVYTSVPYSFAHAPYHPMFDNDKPANLDSIVGNKNDTVFNNTVTPYYYDYAVCTSNSKIYYTAKIHTDAFINGIYMQAFLCSKKQAHQYQVTYLPASHAGVKIGDETSTGFSGTDISYNNPQLTADASGHVLFYVLENGRAARVSPVINNTQLAWGGMGRRTGSGTSVAGYYNPDMPYITISTGGKALLSLNEQRSVPANTGINIYTRHIDSINVSGYSPVYKRVVKQTTFNAQAFPETMVGSSKKFSLVELLNYSNGVFSDASPVAEIMDDKNFGVINMNIYDNTGAIRKYNNKPYLDRNFTIIPGNNISATASVTMRLFFTTDEFNALKTAYPSLTNPSKLAIIKQAYTTGNAPSAYAPITGEVKINVTSWKAVTNGYYVEFAATKFSGYTNYYIFPAANTPFNLLDDVTESSASTQPAKKVFIQNIYPTIINNNSFFIQTGNENVKEVMVEVFDANGKEMLKQQRSYQSQTIQLPIVASGLYRIKISAGELIFNGSIVKQ